MRGWETSRKTLVLRGCWESTERVHGNEAAGRDCNISGSSGERRVPICITCRLESGRGHCSSIYGRGKRLGESALIAASCLRKAVRGLLGWLWTSLALSCTAYTNSTWPDTTWGLKTKGWTGKGGGVYSRHPNPSLVHLKEVRNERVEVDISISEVVERKLLPVPCKIISILYSLHIR
jgi:hypothetical protein